MARKNFKKYWVGFDLGGTKMLATVFDHQFKPVARSRRKTKGAEGAIAGIDRMMKTIDDALGEAGIQRTQLAGIGVGIPGPLDLDRGIVIECANLGWKNIPLQQQVARRYKCPVALANDVDAGTFGEFSFGAGKGGRCVLGVFPGTGIGGGLVYEGRIFRGKRASCLEFGHMMVDPRGRLCGCGRRGCLETVASRLAISADVAMAAYRGECPHIMKTAGTNLSEIRSSLLAEAIKAGDKVTEKIVRNAANRIGEAAANTCNLLAPDIIILGGGMVEALSGIFLQEVREVVDRRVMDSFRKTIRIKVASLGDDATALGAAALVAQKVHGS